MKTAFALAVICLVAASSVSVTSTKQARSHHSSKHHQGLALKQTRDAECSRTCVESGASGSKNWVVKWKGLIIVYNDEHKFFGIVNVKLNLAVIFLVESSTAAIVNLKTGASIIFNIKTGVAVFVAGSGSISFSAIYELVVEYESKVQAGADINSGNCFDLVILIEQININANVNIAAIFESRKELAAKIDAEFAAVFQVVNKALVDGFINVNVGALAIIVGILEVKISIDLAIFEFVVAVFTHEAVKLIATAELFMELHKALLVKTEASIAIGIRYVKSAVALIGKAYGNLSAAIQAIKNKTVALAKEFFVKIGDEVCKVTTSISESKSFVIAISGSASADIDIVITYNASINFLAIYNAKLGYAIILAGKSGYWGILNVKTGVILAINKLLGLAIIVEANASEIAAVFDKAEINFALGFELAAEAVGKAGISIGSAVSGSVISIGQILDSLKTSSSKLIWGALIFNFALKNKIEANFQALFTYLHNEFAKNTNLAMGSLKIIFAFFGARINVIGKAVVTLIKNIYSKLNGHLTADVLESFYATFNVEIEVDFTGSFFAQFNAVFNNIKSGISSLVAAVQGAAQAFAGFHVSIKGGVAVGGGATGSSEGSTGSSTGGSTGAVGDGSTEGSGSTGTGSNNGATAGSGSNGSSAEGEGSTGASGATGGSATGSEGTSSGSAGGSNGSVTGGNGSTGGSISIGGSNGGASSGNGSTSGGSAEGSAGESGSTGSSATGSEGTSGSSAGGSNGSATGGNGSTGGSISTGGSGEGSTSESGGTGSSATGSEGASSGSAGSGTISGSGHSSVGGSTSGGGSFGFGSG